MQTAPPLMLELCPAEALPNVVADALAELTLYERLHLGADLPAVVGLRAEAKLAHGMDPLELDLLLGAADVQTLAAIVGPHLTAMVA